MKRFSKTQVREISAQIDTCGEAAKALEKTVDDYNDAMNEHRDKIENALAAYNQTLANLREIYAGLHSEASEYQNERSEKWQESEAGYEYSAWVESMDDIEGVHDFDYELPEDLARPDLPDWDDTSFLPGEAPGESL